MPCGKCASVLCCRLSFIISDVRQKKSHGMFDFIQVLMNQKTKPHRISNHSFAFDWGKF